MGQIFHIYTVTELTQEIQEVLEKPFSALWVEAEISNLKMPSSGHLYMTLKDQTCQIRGVIFRSLGRHLKFEPQDGQHVLCRGHLTVYGPRGEYQLVVDYLEPKGVGALQLAYEQLKERLREEGLFAPERKRPLPMLPRGVGIITSPTGAVLQDMLRILGRRFPNLSILISPAAVQGEEAVGEIVRAVEDLNHRDGVDVMILARGGGSLEDLWAFNDEKVARAVAGSAIPVISAVGHETDYTIVDFVADLRAPTPSAAAELVVRSREDLVTRIQDLTERSRQAIRVHLEMKRSKSRMALRALPLPAKRLEGLFLRLDDLGWRSVQAILRQFRERRRGLEDRLQIFMNLRPDFVLRHWSALVASQSGRLTQQIARMFQAKHAALAQAEGKLESLSPLAVLGRGYSIARKMPGMEVIFEAKQVSRGDRFILRLQRGELSCRVDEVRNEPT